VDSPIESVIRQLRERGHTDEYILGQLEAEPAFRDQLELAPLRRKQDAVKTASRGKAIPTADTSPAKGIAPAVRGMRPCVAKAGAAMEAAVTARDELVPETGKSPSRQSWEWARDNYYAKNKCPTYDTFCRYVRDYYQSENSTTRVPGQRADSRSAVRAKDQSKR